MGEELFQIIKQVGIFMICAQMILHFKPAQSYGKYIRLLMGMMVLAQLAVPIMGIFGRKGEASFQNRLIFYDAELERQMEKISVTCDTAEKMLETLTMEEIKTRINNSKTEENGEDSAETPEYVNMGNVVGENVAGENAVGENAVGEIRVDRIEVTAGD